MIKLIDNPDAETILRRVKQGKYAKGTVIEYHIGDYSDLIGLTWLGKSMYSLRDKVVLYQKRLSDDPRVYSYHGVVK